MAALYYVNKDGQRHELNDMDLLFHIKREQRGELFLTDNSGVKIGYDTKTGHAQPLSAVETGCVSNLYSHHLFHNSVQPVSRVIRELAKLNLLWELLELKDPLITNIILKRHMQTETGDLSNTKEEILDDTLYKIQQLTAPTLSSAFFNAKDIRSSLHRAVYEALVSVQLEGIHSEDTVVNIMSAIHTQLTQTRNDNIANSSNFSDSNSKKL